MKVRGFEKITKYAAVEFPMPERKTQKLQLVPTGIKAYMQDDEYLGVHIRSSIAVKKHISLVNNQGIIDADYYNNADNEGHIMLALLNMGTEPVALAKNERVAQGIFYKYLVADGDADIDKAVRGGGFGSTTKA